MWLRCPKFARYVSRDPSSDAAKATDSAGSVAEQVLRNSAAPGHSCGSLAAWAGGTQIARAPGWISASRMVDSPTTSPSSW
jgi:hypothetical protein